MNRTTEYAAEIATFYVSAINALIVVVGICLALIVGELLRRALNWFFRND